MSCKHVEGLQVRSHMQCIHPLSMAEPSTSCIPNSQYQDKVIDKANMKGAQEYEATHSTVREAAETVIQGLIVDVGSGICWPEVYNASCCFVIPPNEGTLPEV